MKKNLSLLCVLLINLAGLSGRAEDSAPTAAAPAPRILFITADGFRTDYVEWYNPTNIKKLIAEGVRVLHATNVFPTVTTPNMTSIVTGSYPRTTGIACNSEYIKERDRIVDGPRDNRAETITETLQKAGWKTGVVNHFMLKDRGVTIYKGVDYDDTEKTAEAVLEMLRQKDLRFVGVIFGAADHAGHKFGPPSVMLAKCVT